MVSVCLPSDVKAFDCVDHNKLWEILKEMGIPDHLTCLLRNVYAGQEATVRTGHGTIDWFQMGKEVCRPITIPLCPPPPLSESEIPFEGEIYRVLPPLLACRLQKGKVLGERG